MKICAVYINSKMSKTSDHVKPEDFKSKFVTVRSGNKKSKYGDIDPNDPIQPVTKETLRKFGRVRMGRDKK